MTGARQSRAHALADGPRQARRGLALCIGAVVCALIPTITVAHAGLSLRQRLDLTAEQPTVRIWIDASHAASVSRLSERLREATHLQSLGRRCEASSPDKEHNGSMIVVTLTFDCPAEPDIAVLDAPSAVGMGPIQYIEVKTAQRTTGVFRGPRTTLRLSPEPAGFSVVWGALALIAAALVLAVGRRFGRVDQPTEES